MAEEQQGQEKTEDATARKKSKAREDGQVARSRELNSMALVVGGAGGLLLLMPWGAARVESLTRRIFQSAQAPDGRLLETLSQATNETILTLLPMLGLMFVIGAASSVVMGGFLLSSKAIAFKGNRMNPLKGLQRMVSMKSLVELSKSIAKFVLIASVAFATLSGLFDELLSISALPIRVAMGHGLDMLGGALLLIGSSLAVVAMIDVPFQIHEHNKQLKMTKQEVKDEMKDTEGKPEVRSRIRQLQQEISRRRMLEDVPTADVVITNPDHFSVALRYDNGNMDVPMVVAKGADQVAFRIREVAREHNVLVLEVPALARAVYFNTDIGEEIPAGLYVAVAQVLAYIYQLKQYQQGSGVVPRPLGEVDVPDEYYVAADPGDPV